ncbi:hypothetical protein [Ensifer sp. M14]|uniref:hypothetical protein n=1 Tax=Ensifer sp. M14 TaxID=2203782 RepID=UPI0011C0652A|nr:hypothetical protein [Ensifer sp. M14]
MLTINGGSSSIRFALFTTAQSLIRRLHGKIDRVGQHDTNLAFKDLASGENQSHAIGALDHRLAAFLIEELARVAGEEEASGCVITRN